MKWVKVNSQAIEALSYDDNKESLYIRFKKNGKAYQYFHVPKSVFHNFCTSPSKGRFFHKTIDQQYEYEEMDGD